MKQSILTLLLLLVTLTLHAAGPVKTDCLSTLPQYVRYTSAPGAFCLAADGRAASVLVSSADWEGVVRAAGDLTQDVQRVTGILPRLVQTDEPAPASVLVGTLGKSPLIDRLVEAGKLDASSVSGQWESYLIATVDGCLVIAGSDKRGTIYGIYDLSEKIGVSPWYWWADVPARRSTSLYVEGGRYVQPSPKVKYRGIFINDEWPSFGGWASAKFGGLNSKMYAHLFELLLRLRANYFWPAMWATAFNEDDPENPALADRYGIIMGTSHHEPMMRAHKEYTRRRDEVGEWNYATNKTRLDCFFREGLERNRTYDNLITIGMLCGMPFYLTDFGGLLFLLLLTPLLGLGMGMLCASLAVLYPTLEKIVPMVMRILFFASGLFYSATMLPSYVLRYLWYNPLIQIIEWGRVCLSRGYSTIPYSPEYLVSVTATCLCLGFLMERYVRRRLV